MKKTILIILFLFSNLIFSQKQFTRKDSLQGSLRFERTCFDVLLYDLILKVNPEQKSIVGVSRIAFKVVENTKKIQIDLFENMKIDSILLQGKTSNKYDKKLKYQREFNAVFIEFEKELLKDEEQAISFYYSGKPLIAKNAPWDGGFVWNKDKNGKPFIGVAVQGTGASLWFPCKDSQTDEPELGLFMTVTVPNDLIAVSNGILLAKEKNNNNETTWIWRAQNPINNYNITLNIADYAHIQDNHNGLPLDYYVLSYNKEKAIKHFEEVKPMLDCFQSKFGEFPFKSDGYKLVETPYLGMEHQSCVAYGNKFMKGYLGSDLSGTGVGLLFDYITIHESGHEWFGNSITSADIADMWIHEGFTQYTEIVYIECQFGYEKSQIYATGLQKNVRNDRPIIGNYGVNNEGSGDMYPKGALLINTIRHIINDDAKWWKLILDYSNEFKHKIITTEMVIDFFNKNSGINLTPVFNQYLRYKDIPVLELKKIKNKIHYRWKSNQRNFNMPVDIQIKSIDSRIIPTTEWQILKPKIKNWNQLTIRTDRFFIDVEKI